VVTPLDMTAIVKNLETLTTIVENTDGTFTYRDEQGDPHVINMANLETLTSIALNPDNTNIDYTDEDGVVTPLDMTAIVKNLETLTEIEGNVAEDNGNTIFRISYTDEKSVQNMVDITATNGLQIDGTTGAIKFGGELNESTTINTNGNTLAITGLEYSSVSDDKIVVADATTGELKALKATMPKFFYMPSIIIPTAPDQLENPATFGTIDLYEQYQGQFGTPRVSNPGATIPLPVLPRIELDYHVTWFDENVFENVNVSDLGILTYTVKTNADVTIGSFMNIVFAVKP
ncbi:hypothetical protein, partial [Parapedobacter pyrenivorans]|uniref:hypothetical protein n=1 Tax=Parapedobacter pyrenivorans TaxID=1305674 RepID=UPI00333F529F